VAPLPRQHPPLQWLGHPQQL